jgi:hypothetical protein
MTFPGDCIKSIAVLMTANLQSCNGSDVFVIIVSEYYFNRTGRRGATD